MSEEDPGKMILRVLKDAGRSALLEAALDVVSKDMHSVSSRPCETCRFVSNALGQPFGCYAFQDKKKTIEKERL